MAKLLRMLEKIKRRFREMKRCMIKNFGDILENRELKGEGIRKGFHFRN
jgi:hypothetical protein